MFYGKFFKFIQPLPFLKRMIYFVSYLVIMYTHIYTYNLYISLAYESI